MKRNLFNELSQALTEATAFEQGKQTLKTVKVERKQHTLAPEKIKAIREGFNMSRAVFAMRLHISPRTLEKWEQGLSKPNEQATTLLLPTERYPDTLERLSTV